MSVNRIWGPSRNLTVEGEEFAEEMPGPNWNRFLIFAGFYL